MVLPDMSGPEIIKDLDPSCSGIPVLFMTGDIGGAIQRGDLVSADYPQPLQKPFSQRRLLERISEVLGESKD